MRSMNDFCAYKTNVKMQKLNANKLRNGSLDEKKKKQFESNKSIWIPFYNYEVSTIGAKLTDGLEETIQPSALDIIIIESNGRNKAENVPHMLDDTIKLLKSSIDAF